MKKTLKKLLVLALVLSCALSFSVFADQGKKVDKEKIGQELKELNLIYGDNGDLMTNDPLTREQAVIVLCRLMQKGKEASEFESKLNFEDIKNEFYAPYIAYAVDQKWVYGRTETKFGYADQVTGQEFAALLIRALNYDCEYSKVPEFAKELGLIDKVEQYDLSIDDKLTRGDAFILMKNSLFAIVDKDPNSKNLYEKLNFSKYADLKDKIVILHTNDMHGFYEESKYEGMGAAKVKRYINLVKADCPDALYLDAGDNIQGSNMVSLSKGDAAIDVLNGFGLDASALGNHEFDYGVENLDKLVKKATFPMIACNVNDKNGKRLYTPYIIKEVKGKKIAIIGFATPETSFKSHPDNTKGLEFVEPVKAAKEVLAELKGKADIFIAVAHLGDEKLEEDFTSINLANNIPELDLIVDGHSHSTYPEGKLVNGVMIVSAGGHTKNVGYVTIDPSDVEKAPVAKMFTKDESKYIGEDKETAAVVAKIKEENKVIESQEIKETPVKLIGDREVVRKGESNLGNLLTTAIKNYSKADIAFTNGGGIRDSIDKGMVTKGDILRVFPFGNTVRVIEISGKDLKDALEHGFSVYPEANGGFPHVAGISVKFDAKKEAGSRIVELKVNGEKLDEAKKYTFATNDFLVAGGDGYKMFKDKPVVAEFGAMDEILIQYIQEKGFEDAKLTNWLEILNK